MRYFSKVCYVLLIALFSVSQQKSSNNIKYHHYLSKKKYSKFIVFDITLNAFKGGAVGIKYRCHSAKYHHDYRPHEVTVRLWVDNVPFVGFNLLIILQGEIVWIIWIWKRYFRVRWVLCPLLFPFCVKFHISVLDTVVILMLWLMIILLVNQFLQTSFSVK